MPGIEVVSPSRHSAYGIRPEQGKCPAFAAKGNTAAQDQPQSLVCGPKPSPARLDRLEKPEMSEMCEGSPKSEGRSAPSAKLPKGSSPVSASSSPPSVSALDLTLLRIAEESEERSVPARVLPPACSFLLSVPQQIRSSRFTKDRWRRRRPARQKQRCSSSASASAAGTISLQNLSSVFCSWSLDEARQLLSPRLHPRALALELRTMPRLPWRARPPRPPEAEAPPNVGERCNAHHPADPASPLYRDLSSS